VSAPLAGKKNGGFQIFSDENSEPERRAVLPAGSAWAELPVEREVTKENTLAASRWTGSGLDVKPAAQQTATTFKIFQDAQEEDRVEPSKLRSIAR
jgi:hypothetical protein